MTWKSYSHHGLGSDGEMCAGHCHSRSHSDHFADVHALDVSPWWFYQFSDSPSHLCSGVGVDVGVGVSLSACVSGVDPYVCGGGRCVRDVPCPYPRWGLDATDHHGIVGYATVATKARRHVR